MNIKQIRTVLSIISIVSAIVLWLSRSEWLPSLSSFALSDNAIYYRVMHITASWFFLLGGRNNSHDYFLAFGMGLILSFDMYHYPILHNTVTILTLLFACFSLIYKASRGFERSLAIFLSSMATGVFLVGYFVPSFHLLIAEIIAMAGITCGKLREIWNYELSKIEI